MVNVIGLGYIGLPTALMLAAHGVEVVGTDYNRQLIETLNAGETTFEEVGLDELSHPIGKEWLDQIYLKNERVPEVVTEYLTGEICK